jgi:hypothetical protein
MNFCLTDVTEYLPPRDAFSYCAARDSTDDSLSQHLLAIFRNLSAECPLRVQKWPGTDGGLANAMATFYKPFVFAFTHGLSFPTPTLTEDFSIYQGCEKEGLGCYFQKSPAPATNCNKTQSVVYSTGDVMWMRHNHSFAVSCELLLLVLLLLAFKTLCRP